MLRWVCQQSPNSQIVSQVFDSSMLIIKTIIEMTPEKEQLKIVSGELFENLRPSTIVQSKNDGSKRGREVGNDEGDLKKSKKQKSKSKMKKAIRNLQDRVAVVEGQLTRFEGDRKGFEGLVDHILKSEEVDNAKTEDVDTSGTSHWLRMPKEDDTSNEAKHIELKKKGDVSRAVGAKEPTFYSRARASGATNVSCSSSSTTQPTPKQINLDDSNQEEENTNDYKSNEGVNEDEDQFSDDEFDL
ncbi:uncharacterized protein E5676_scaffold209G00890 [Cucumis melo var. makuwa]|uniref:Uncharacterized protein n=1 Tax=Cucumis melo var. makuwa TaxID=1194695 RepID=A0A5D3CW81_CUCMM|nr:uncharacterized protein E6C27_scaffold171G007350 [Cucumis melo var. makuwa]TYK16161.1 uncharacterized protein E5676_scaffold209G00890 [Cucumis melo var. makuwa]